MIHVKSRLPTAAGPPLLTRAKLGNVTIRSYEDVGWGRATRGSQVGFQPVGFSAEILFRNRIGALPRLV